MSKIVCHMLAPAHEASNKSDEFLTGAFTQTLLNFTKGLKDNPDLELIHYGHEDSDTSLLNEHVTVVTNDDWRKDNLHKLDRMKEPIGNRTIEHTAAAYKKNVLRELHKRSNRHDFILTFGDMQRFCLPELYEVPGILVQPSQGHFEPIFDYRVYVSYAIMNMTYGKLQTWWDVGQHIQSALDNTADWNVVSIDNNNKTAHDWTSILGDLKNRLGISNVDHYGQAYPAMFMPRWSDAVIPCPIDFDDFEYTEDKEDYFIFTARMQEDKGLKVAVEVTKEIGADLVCMGQGNAAQAIGLSQLPKHVKHVGAVGIEQRRKIMAKAKGAFIPSMYSEPFGMVVTEAGASGTPVISTDWGAFAENIKHGVSGYRCRSFDQFIWAADSISNIQPADCYRFASQFRLQVAAKKYDHYFKTLREHILHGNRQNQSNPQFTPDTFWYTDTTTKNLDWLNDDMIEPPTTEPE